MGIKKDTQPEMLQFLRIWDCAIDLGKRWNHQNFKIMFPLTKTHLGRESGVWSSL